MDLSSIPQHTLLVIFSSTHDPVEIEPPLLGDLVLKGLSS